MVERKEENDNLLLLKSFLEGQEKTKVIKLTFFTRGGRTSANMEIDPIGRGLDRTELAGEPPASAAFGFSVNADIALTIYQ